MVLYTDSKINALKSASKRQIIQIDKRLYLRIEVSGAKSWQIRYTKDGAQRSKIVGSFCPDSAGHISLGAAKILAVDIPAGEKAGVTKFGVIAENWLGWYAQDHAAATIEAVSNRYKNHIEKSALYGINISDITRRDIAELIDSIGVKQPETAQKVLSIVKMIFTWAINRGFCDSNPTPGANGLIRKNRIQNRAAVTDNPQRFGEIVAMIQQNYLDYGYTSAALLLFLAYCFSRPGETRHLQWRHVDFSKKIIEIPPEQTKTRQPLMIPLAPQVISLLQNLQNQRGEEVQPDDYIFYSPQKGPRYPLSDAIPTLRLVKLNIPRAEQSAHGFRACASTYLREYLRADSEAIERQLNHVTGTAISRVYNKSQYLEARVQMMQDWADWVDAQAKEAAEKTSKND